jgi:hypothetical protein
VLVNRHLFVGSAADTVATPFPTCGACNTVAGR